MRAAAIGIWGGVSGLGVALGPVIGGAVVEGVSWQAIFWLNVPVALVACRCCWSPSPSRGAPGARWTCGDVLLGGAVFLGIWGIVHGNDDGWSVARRTRFAGSRPSWSRRTSLHARGRTHAVLPLRLFARRGVLGANAIGLFFTLGMFGAVFLLSQYLQIVQGYSPLEAGVRTLPWTAAPMIVAPIAGLIAPRTGLRALLLGRAGAAGRVAGLVRVPDRGRLRLLRLRPGRSRWPGSGWA